MIGHTKQFAHNIEEYLEQLSQDNGNPEARSIRHLLGDPKCASMSLTGPANTRFSKKVSALLSSYCILDHEVLQYGSVVQNSQPPVPQTLNELGVLPRHPSRILERLKNWQAVLTEFNKAYLSDKDKTKVQVAVSINPDSKIPRSMAHLQHLGETYASQALQNMIQNFREASLHYTFLQELATSLPKALPDIPETSKDVETLILPEQELAKYDVATRKKISAYLTDHQPAEIRRPFQIALLVSMLVLLFPTSLHIHTFPRGILNKVCISIICVFV